MNDSTEAPAGAPRTDKRALRKQYKESKPPMGVFMIRNTANGQMYLGASTNVEGAMNRHRFELQMKTHRNKKLLRDWFAYGAEQFRFELFDRLQPREEADVDYAGELAALLEIWREELGTYGEQGYNQRTQVAGRPHGNNP